MISWRSFAKTPRNSDSQSSEGSDGWQSSAHPCTNRENCSVRQLQHLFCQWPMRPKCLGHPILNNSWSKFVLCNVHEHQSQDFKLLLAFFFLDNRGGSQIRNNNRGRGLLRKWHKEKWIWKRIFVQFSISALTWFFSWATSVFFRFSVALLWWAKHHRHSPRQVCERQLSEKSPNCSEQPR